MSRVAIVCPGRGSYTEKTMRRLPAEHALVARAEELRREFELPSLVELDTAPRFSPATHLRPANVSLLIWLSTLLDCERAAADHQVVAIAGNSMGWYTALAAGGALSFDDGFRLVQVMSLLQEQHAVGGQILYPLVGEDWRRDAQLVAAVDDALASSNGDALRSIDLGGFAVLAGSEAGIAHLLRALPQIKLGANTYPFRLVQHAAYHTPLVAAVSEQARGRLAGLAFGAPRTTLVDGRGVRFTPWSTDVAALAAYTLGPQVVEPYDLTLSLRVVLREHAPELLVLPGPGNTLGGVCGQVLVAEGWRGIRSKVDFERAQQSERPAVLSMGR